MILKTPTGFSDFLISGSRIGTLPLTLILAELELELELELWVAGSIPAPQRSSSGSTIDWLN
tara:strand:+ start:1612 stop:1797 length:186 start_codon:yes stop_codon:yes gene_type:complete